MPSVGCISNKTLHAMPGRQQQIRVRKRQSHSECAARGVEHAVNHGYDGGVDSPDGLLRSDFSLAACVDSSVVSK